MRSFRSTLPQPVALVPTMGMLHRGHMALARIAAQRAPSVIVSVYVNPTQLSPGESRTYPSTLDQDVMMIQRLNEKMRRTDPAHGRIEAVFAPTDGEMYAQSTDLEGGWCSHVVISPSLTERLEGKGRPGHFIGVATVCLKLFNLVMPQVAVFGEKDYQQVLVVRRLVDDFLMNIEVIMAETVREADGLALSSRNVYLGSRRREAAVVLWRALRAGAATYRSGRRERTEILGACAEEVSKEQERLSLIEDSNRIKFEVLYFELSDCQTLEDLGVVGDTEKALLSGAINMLPLEETLSVEDAESRDQKRSIKLIDSVVLRLVEETL